VEESYWRQLFFHFSASERWRKRGVLPSFIMWIWGLGRLDHGLSRKAGQQQQGFVGFRGRGFFPIFLLLCLY